MISRPLHGSIVIASAMAKISAGLFMEKLSAPSQWRYRKDYPFGDE
jgi:hypothetical protein